MSEEHHGSGFWGKAGIIGQRPQRYMGIQEYVHGAVPLKSDATVSSSSSKSTGAVNMPLATPQEGKIKIDDTEETADLFPIGNEILVKELAITVR